MTTKLKTEDIVAAMKKAVKTSKPLTSKPLEKLIVKPTHRERDMRQDAIDMGAHGSEEYFGVK